MKYFSKASKAILYSYYLLYTVYFLNTAIAPIKKNLDKYRNDISVFSLWILLMWTRPS